MGQAIQFFVSEYISPETNLFVLLVVTILAVPLFTIADVHYGSGTSRKICGEKRPASVDIGCDQHEPASVSVGKEKGVCVRGISPLHAVHIRQPHVEAHGPHGKAHGLV